MTIIMDSDCFQDPIKRTLPNDITTTQSSKSGTWTEDLMNSLPTLSSTQKTSDIHKELEDGKLVLISHACD